MEASGYEANPDAGTEVCGADQGPALKEHVSHRAILPDEQ
jgi:hypothetical protein